MAKRSNAPWELGKLEHERYAHADARTQQKILDGVVEQKKRWTSTSSKWRGWEEGRKKALGERRDYFRNNPDKKDDHSGV